MDEHTMQWRARTKITKIVIKRHSANITIIVYWQVRSIARMYTVYIYIYTAYDCLLKKVN